MFKSLALAATMASMAAADLGAWSYNGMKHGDAIEGEYLVQMRGDVATARATEFVQALVDNHDANIHYNSKFGKKRYGLRNVNAEALEKLQSNPDVELITPNQVVTIAENVGKTIVDNGVCADVRAPSWGLARTTFTGAWDPSNVPTTMAFDDEACGEGVQLHVLDTGVEFNHIDFAELVDYASGDFTLEGDFDGHGHGTHVASTAAGAAYGFAKCAQVVSLKVLASSGAGNLFSILGAMEIGQEEAEKGNRVVSNMSLGALVNPILNEVATAVADAGVLMAVAAGNDNTDAALASPASADRVWTVGASDVNDRRSVFSNWGTLINIFAPGTDIKAACPLETNAHPIPVASCGQIAGRPGQECVNVGEREHCYAVISGTSMACPHAAGVAAAYWSKRANTDKSNFDIQGDLEAAAFQNVLFDEAGNSEGLNGSPNRLLKLDC